VGTAATFSQPLGVAMSSDGTFAVTSCKASHRIRRIVISTIVVTTLAGNGGAGSTNGVGTNSSFNGPYDVALSSDDSFALVCDYINNQIRKIVLSTTIVSTLVGSSAAAGYTNGIGTNAAFSSPVSLSVSSDDTVVYISEQTGRVRKLVLSSLAVTLLAGGSTGSTGPVDGIGSLASFNSPRGILLTRDDMYLYVSDFSNNKIRRVVVSTQSVSTLVMGAGIPAVSAPHGLAWLSNDDSVLLVVCRNSENIRDVYGTCPAPTSAPTVAPTRHPSRTPSSSPTRAPTVAPTRYPTGEPSMQPTVSPSGHPSGDPTVQPSGEPLAAPAGLPTGEPSRGPTGEPSTQPTVSPSGHPSGEPTGDPTVQPSGEPSAAPAGLPTGEPSSGPSGEPSTQPTVSPSGQPSGEPTGDPTVEPSGEPSAAPAGLPTGEPSRGPTGEPNTQPTVSPSGHPSGEPTGDPTVQPSGEPSVAPTELPTSPAPSTAHTKVPTMRPTAVPTKVPTSAPLMGSSPPIKPTAPPTIAPSLSKKSLWLEKASVVSCASYTADAVSRLLFTDLVVDGRLVLGGCVEWSVLTRENIPNRLITNNSVKLVWTTAASIDADFVSTCEDETAVAAIVNSLRRGFSVHSGNWSSVVCGNHSWVTGRCAGSSDGFLCLDCVSTKEVCLTSDFPSVAFAYNGTCTSQTDNIGFAYPDNLNVLQMDFATSSPIPKIISKNVSSFSNKLIVNATFDIATGFVSCVAYPSADNRVLNAVDVTDMKESSEPFDASFTAITIDDLYASLSYDVYCATFSQLHDHSPLMQVAESKTVVQASCCRELLVELSLTSFSSSTDTRNALVLSTQGSLTATNLTVHLDSDRHGTVVHPFSQSQVHFTGLTSRQSVAYLRQTSGNYWLNFTLSGADAVHYTIKYNVDRFVVLGLSEAPVPPVMTSARFSSSGVYLEVALTHRRIAADMSITFNATLCFLLKSKVPR
jgi:hypothetical protein